MEKNNHQIRPPNDSRLLYIAEGFRNGLSLEEIYSLSKIDRWFLSQIQNIISFESNINVEILHNHSLMQEAKSLGFSDRMIAYLINKNDGL